MTLKPHYVPAILGPIRATLTNDWHITHWITPTPDGPLLTLISISVAFSPQTIRDWNALPDSLISSAKGAKDGVAKFISLVRAMD